MLPHSPTGYKSAALDWIDEPPLLPASPSSQYFYYYYTEDGEDDLEISEIEHSVASAMLASGLGGIMTTSGDSTNTPVGHLAQTLTQAVSSAVKAANSSHEAVISKQDGPSLGMFPAMSGFAQNGSIFTQLASRLPVRASVTYTPSSVIRARRTARNGSLPLSSSSALFKDAAVYSRDPVATSRTISALLAAAQGESAAASPSATGPLGLSVSDIIPGLAEVFNISRPVLASSRFFNLSTPYMPSAAGLFNLGMPANSMLNLPLPTTASIMNMTTPAVASMDELTSAGSSTLRAAGNVTTSSPALTDNNTSLADRLAQIMSQVQVNTTMVAPPAPSFSPIFPRLDQFLSRLQGNSSNSFTPATTTSSGSSSTNALARAFLANTTQIAAGMTPFTSPYSSNAPLGLLTSLRQRFDSMTGLRQARTRNATSDLLSTSGNLTQIMAALVAAGIGSNNTTVNQTNSMPGWTLPTLSTPVNASTIDNATAATGSNHTGAPAAADSNNAGAANATNPFIDLYRAVGVNGTISPAGVILPQVLASSGAAIRP